MKNWLVPILAAIGIIGLVSILLSDPAKSQVASVTLSWTAPGDDGVVGTATNYEMRYSTSRPDTTNTSAMDSWWAAATPVSSMPIPQVAGTAQSKVVTATFLVGSTYYFVMKACDEVPNCSPYSNVATKFIPDTIPPAKVVSLFAQ